MKSFFERTIGRGIIRTAVSCAALAMSLSAWAQAPKSYEVIDLGTLKGTATGVFVGASGNSINNNGKIVGFSYKDQIPDEFGGLRISPHGVTFDPFGSPTDLTDPLFPATDYSSQLVGINDSNQILGFVFNNNTFSGQPYIFHPDGTVTPLSLPAGITYSFPTKITNTNIILGPAGNNTCLWNIDGTRTDLPALAGRSVRDINDAGTLVGYYYDFASNRVKSFVYDATNGAQNFPFTGNFGYLTAINNKGVLGGEVDGRATLWLNGGTQQKDIHPGFGTTGVGKLTDSGLAIVGAQFGNDFLSCFYDGEKVRTIMSMVPTSSPFVRIIARGITEDGRIVGQGFKRLPPNFYSTVESTAVLLVPSTVELPHPTNIAPDLRVRFGRPTYDPTTKLWVIKITLTNPSRTTIPGPFYVTLGGDKYPGQVNYVTNSMTPKPDGQITNGPQTGSNFYKVTPVGGKLTPGKTATLTLSVSLGTLPLANDLYVSAVFAGTGRP